MRSKIFIASAIAVLAGVIAAGFIGFGAEIAEVAKANQSVYRVVGRAVDPQPIRPQFQALYITCENTLRQCKKCHLLVINGKLCKVKGLQILARRSN